MPDSFPTDIDRRYEFANKAGWVLLVIALAICALPEVPNWVFLLMVGLIAGTSIFLATFKRGAISKRVLKARANQGLPLLVGGVPLLFTVVALYRFHLIDRQWPIIVAIVIGMPLSYLTYLPQWGGEIKNKAPILVAAVLFGWFGSVSLIWSGIMFANGITAPTLLAIHRVRVSAKHRTYNNEHNSHWINVIGPPNLNGIVDFNVDAKTYYQVNEKDYACVSVWSGALTLRWYTVKRC